MFRYLIVCCLIALCHGLQSSPVVRDYCINKVFQPDCGSDVIVINHAFYGRMKLGTCITQSFGVMGCQENVTEVLNQECFARSTCEMAVTDDRLFGTSPCGNLLNYLEVSYTCLSVISSPREQCDNGDLLKITSPTTGYLTSSTSRHTGCGARGSPWLIESLEEKSILITLLDLTVPGTGGSGSAICLVYALIREAGSDQSETVCGGQSRERLVYRSRTDAIQVTVISKERHFLLKYQFVGCSNMETETGMTNARTNRNETRVSCENNEQTSIFRCDGTKWEGQLPNCTVDEPAPSPDHNVRVKENEKRPVTEKEETPSRARDEEYDEMVSFNLHSITWGMVLIVIGIITGGIVACVFIIAVVYLKRKAIECKGPILVPRPVSEAGYEVCDFDISQCTSSVYRDGYLTVPKDYTPMMNGTLPKYKKPDVWERPLPAEPNHV